MRVAIIHDWLLGMRGGERCLEVLCAMFPEVDLYTAFYRREGVSPEIASYPVHVSALSHLPGVDRYYRHLLPFYPFAARSLERSLRRQERDVRYDLVISVSHCLAKNVQVPESALHICYCLTPMRYLWDHYQSYFEGKKLEPLIRRMVRPLRRWDVARAEGVDCFIGISEYIRERIRKVYDCPAEVVYPPVRSDWITPRAAEDDGDGFLCVSALVPYKNVEMIVRTFNDLPYRLTVVGSGPEYKKLSHIAGSNISLLERVSDLELARLYRKSKALVFAAEEDFGMTPVEMQAAGRAVICYGRGGALETVSAEKECPTGVYFPELTTASLSAAVGDFVSRQSEFTVDNCLKQSEKFSVARFQSEFSKVLDARGLDSPRELRQQAETEEQAMAVGSRE